MRALFVARREPWRLSELSLERREDDVVPAVAAWADAATAVLIGHPARQQVVGPRQSWGTLGAKHLLVPDVLAKVVQQPWPERFELDGRALEQDLELVPELVTLGCDRYVAAYDGQVGVITDWTAFIGGAVAQRIQLRDVRPVTL